MKIIVIGQSGSGKSTLARKIKEITDFPLLPLEFLSFIWHFEENNEPKIQQLIQVANARNKLIILKTRREKQEFLTKLKIESKNN
ncbi:AAA family ATPase [Enterococcus faecium]|uniref:AAA family ATPase n=1 Tax=Enterococcus faecium TaxID=1352 RepID=UPI0002A356FF|nr:AAA family ATPase [Enterococcus faecium]ELB12835.1 hypothetical protein OIM_03451 [Enterococcus faecium EnGen0032]